MGRIPCRSVLSFHAASAALWQPGMVMSTVTSLFGMSLILRRVYPSQAGSEAAAHHQGHRGDRGSSLRLLNHLFESELKSCISQASCYEPLPTGLNLLQRVGSPQRMAMRVL